MKLLQNISNAFQALLGKRGWRESWARGDDTGGGGSGGNLSTADAAQHTAWVFACLQFIAGPVRALPLQWFATSARGKESEVHDKELRLFWKRPAATVSGKLSFGDFVELSLHSINLHGQAFWILDDTWLKRGGTKSPILLARADRMTPVMNGDELVGWRFMDGGRSMYHLLKEQVIRPRFPNPFHDEQGLAPLDAAITAASADHAAGVFARNVAQSNGDQGVYVVSKSGTLSAEQRDQIIAQLRQKSRLAKSGDFRAAFLTADVTIEDPKVKSVDAAFSSGRTQNKYEIAVAFGVPPSMMDKMDSYSIGGASDRYRLIEQACIPHADRLAKAMAEVEYLRTGTDLDARFDWTQNPTLAAARNERLKTAAEVHVRGVPWSELNDTLQLGLNAFPGHDKAWLPMSLEPVDDGTRKDHEEETQTHQELEAGDDAQKTLAQRGAALNELRTLLQRATSTANSEQRTENPEANSERFQLWQKHMKARAPSEKLFKRKFNKCLMEARRETLAKIEASAKHLAGARQRGVLDLIFDLAKFTLSLTSELRKAHEATIDEATGQLVLELGLDDPWKMESPKVLEFLKARESYIKDAAKEVFEEIQETLEEGLQGGETTAELAGRVKAAFNGIADHRATAIAVTETGAAYGVTRHTAIEELDIPYKQWLDAGDEKVRRTHRRVGGTIIPYDQPFEVEREDGGVDLMMHPCDSEGGSAENCIHCRCIELPMMEEDKEAAEADAE